MTDRTLTDAQSRILMRLAFVAPAAKVVDWDHDFHGPIVKITDDEFWVIEPNQRHLPRRSVA